MARLLIEPTQEKIQAYHHHPEVEESADAADSATTAVSVPDLPSKNPPIRDPTFAPSDTTIQYPLSLISPFPPDKPSVNLPS